MESCTNDGDLGSYVYPSTVCGKHIGFGGALDTKVLFLTSINSILRVVCLGAVVVSVPAGWGLGYSCHLTA